MFQSGANLIFDTSFLYCKCHAMMPDMFLNASNLPIDITLSPLSTYTTPIRHCIDLWYWMRNIEYYYLKYVWFFANKTATDATVSWIKIYIFKKTNKLISMFRQILIILLDFICNHFVKFLKWELLSH